MTLISFCVCVCVCVQVPSSRVFRGGEGATKNLKQGRRLVSGSDLLPVPLRTQGTTLDSSYYTSEKVTELKGDKTQIDCSTGIRWHCLATKKEPFLVSSCRSQVALVWKPYVFWLSVHPYISLWNENSKKQHLILFTEFTQSLTST